MSNNILVTGGAGYIGSHCCKYLHSIGYNPICYDNLSRGNKDSVKWGPLIEGDIGDVETLREVFNSYDLNAVIHFAGYAYVTESVESPSMYYKNNVSNSCTLIEECRLAGINNFIFSSSCATYGSPKIIPILEDAIQNPINPYGRSKLIIEGVLDDYSNAYGFNSISLRYFNAGGASEDSEIGENHSPETHLIPNVILAGLKVKNYLSVYGNSFDTEDGTAIRDYIHVEDLAKAHAKALDYLLKNQHGISHKFNLGTGKGTSINQIIKMTENFLGVKIDVKYFDARQGDPKILVADSTLARNILGLDFNNSNIENIILTSINWLKRLHNEN